MNAQSDRFNVRYAAFVLALMFGSSTALADEPITAPTSPEVPPAAPLATRAEVLFQEGKTFLEQGRFKEACARLAESDGLDPNISTVGLLAACHEQQGDVVMAVRIYKETLKRAEAAGDSRAQFARERVAALEPRVPKLVPPDGPARVSEVPPLKGSAPSASPSANAVNPPPISSKGMGPREISALVSGGVALTGVVLGTAFAVKTSSLNAESIAIAASCNTHSACEEGHALRDSAFQAATISSVGFGAALVGTAITIVLLIIPSGGSESPSKAIAARNVWIAPRIGVDEGGVAMIGRF